jgi:hypothetical protein
MLTVEASLARLRQFMTNPARDFAWVTGGYLTWHHR